MAGTVGYWAIDVQEGVGEKAVVDAAFSSTISFKGSVKPFACNFDSCLIFCIILAC